jgi:hypothetical protein
MDSGANNRAREYEGPNLLLVGRSHLVGSSG